MNRYNLANKTSIVTGGSRGIGLGISKKLLQSGSDVVILSQSEWLKQETLDELKVLGNIDYLCVDVSDYNDVKSKIKKITEKFNKIDILVNNAGITIDKLAIRTSDSDWDKVLNTNLKGYFNCIKSVLPYMIKQRFGKIINISSVIGIKGNQGQSSYSASKAGIIGLTKSIAKEYGAKSINVNAIAPGYIKTEMTDNINSDKFLDNITLKRAGLPEDVANLVCFLSSDDSSYITGQVIGIDGGLVI